MYGGQQCQKGMLSFSLDLPKYFTSRPDHPRDCYSCVYNMGDFWLPTSGYMSSMCHGANVELPFFPPLLPSLSLALSCPFPNSSHWGHLSKSSFIYATDLVCHTRAALLWAHYAWIRFVNCKTWWNSLPFTSLTFLLWLGNVEQWWLWLPGVIPRWKLKFWSFLYAKRGWLLLVS